MTDHVASCPETEASHNKRYTHDVAWNVLAMLFLQGSTFVVNIILANILGKEQFGEFGMVQSTLLTLASIAQLATGVTATKYVAEYRDTDPSRAVRILGLCSDVTFFFGFIGTIILLFGAGWLSEGFFEASHLKTVIIFGSAFVLFSAVNGYQLGALAGLGSFRLLARASIAQAFIYITVCVSFGWLYGVPGAVSALAFTAFARWAVYGLVLKRELRRRNMDIDRKQAWQERSVLWGFTLPSAITGLSSMPAIWLANAFLARQPNGFSELGVYGAAVAIKSIILLLPQVFNNVGITFLNNRLGAKDSISFWSIYRLNLIVSGVGVAMGILFLALAGRWVLSLFGDRFSDGYYVLLILLVSSFFEALAISVYQIIQSSGRMWLSFFTVALPRDILFVFLAIYLSPTYGAAGVAVAYTTAWFVAFCTIIFIAKNLSRGLALKLE